MVSTPLSLVILLLPFLALRGAHCLDPDIHERPKSVQEMEHARPQDMKKVEREKSAEDEIIDDTVVYNQDGDEEGGLTERADVTRREREGRKLADRRKETKTRRVKNKSSERKITGGRGGDAEKGSKGKKGFNIMEILRRNKDSKKTKKKKPAGKSGKKGKGNRKGPPRRKENKDEIEADDDDAAKSNVRRGNIRGNHRKGATKLQDIKQSLVTTRNHPVFSFSSKCYWYY